MTRVVVADDSLLFRRGLVLVLEDAGFDVVGETADVVALPDLVRTTSPELAVLDIRMPPTHTVEGIVAARTLRATHPDLRLLLLSQHIETRTALELLDDRRGGIGYLLKDRVTAIDDFTAAVRRVAAGGTAVDPDVVQQIVRRAREPQHPISRLSDRELDVLSQMAEGLSNAAIAEALRLSERTVEAHVRSTFTKLDLDQESGTHRRVLAVLTFLSTR